MMMTMEQVQWWEQRRVLCCCFVEEDYAFAIAIVVVGCWVIETDRLLLFGVG